MNLDFSNIKVLLIGDFMIDHYVMGESNRISPEAPVPVVVPYTKFSIPGGAGNVAMNMSALGANVDCVGLVGDDKWGHLLIKILKQNNISTDLINISEKHQTTLKTRIYCDGLQVARIDEEKQINNHMDFMNFSYKYDNYDIIVLSDYNKGVLSFDWVPRLKNIDILLDPKNDKSDHLLKNSNIITPNILELEKLSGKKISNNNSIIDACKLLIQKYKFKYVISKKGDKGITVVGPKDFVYEIDGHKVENPDVTGAGDTVISSFALAYAKTGNIKESARIANLAASIAVSKVGTSTVLAKELSSFLTK